MPRKGTIIQLLQKSGQGIRGLTGCGTSFLSARALAVSPVSIHFSIKSPEEARAYLDHSILGPRLHECVDTLLSLDGRTAHQIFGSPDDLKLKSSMTLFAHVSSEGSVFEQVIDKYYEGQRDQRSIELFRK